MLPGSPATLGYVVAPDNNGRTDPEIEPYPNFAMNEIGNCSALQFVQGIAIDARGILWAVDSGRVNTLLPGNSSSFSEHITYTELLELFLNKKKIIFTS